MRIVLFTDSSGIQQFKHSSLFDKGRVVAVVGAFNRPQSLSELSHITKVLNVPLIIQPKYQGAGYEKFVNQISSLNPSHIVSNSYSLIIRPDILNIVENNAVNIHWSLLPRNRGPNPVQWSLIKGEEKTGVSLHRISDLIDEGSILSQDEVCISKTDTWVTLREKLLTLSQNFIDTRLEKTLTEMPPGLVQDETKATLNTRINADFPRIDFDMPDEQIYNLIRAQVAPLYGAFIELKSGRIYFRNLTPMEQISKMRLLFSSGNEEELKKLAQQL